MVSGFLEVAGFIKNDPFDAKGPSVIARLLGGADA